MQQPRIIVLKFGSSVLRSVSDLPSAVHEIYRWYRDGFKVIAVASAIGRATEVLLAQAHDLCRAPDPHATAELLGTGERACAALLGIALDRAGVPARVVDPREIGLAVEGDPLDGHARSVDIETISEFLQVYPVLIVPGFFGIGACGRTALLGRGGSDLTAVFLAAALAGRCRLIKDVDGVYDVPPAASTGLFARRLAAIGYEDARKVAGRLIQAKAIAHLEQRRHPAEVAALALPYESIVHDGLTSGAGDRRARPTRVLLLGLGTVGFGVYQRLLAHPEHFNLCGALIRDRTKYESLGVPRELLYTDESYLRRLRPDLVIDALPGLDPGAGILREFLAQGVDVVSANKTVIAECGTALTSEALCSRAALRYSAAVGGGTPMIEAIERAASQARLTSIQAVLNGTCNFVLDRCAEGAPLAEAVRAAQRLGFAEADPSDDLSGLDAQRKLYILARRGFAERLGRIDAEPLTDAVAAAARQALPEGMRLRQIARAFVRGNRVAGTIRFERVPPTGTFGALSKEWNALEIACADGQRVSVRGRGAGRWPTTEAVMGDVWALRRHRT